MCYDGHMIGPFLASNFAVVDVARAGAGAGARADQARYHSCQEKAPEVAKEQSGIGDISSHMC